MRSDWYKEVKAKTFLKFIQNKRINLNVTRSVRLRKRFSFFEEMKFDKMLNKAIKKG